MAVPAKRMRPDDPRFDDWVRDILNAEEETSDEETAIDVPDLASDHESESEQSIDGNVEEDESEQTDRIRNQFYGKNRFKWSTQEPQKNVRTRRDNIISHLPGVIGEAKQKGMCCSQLSAWELLFTKEILEEIILRTNQKLEQTRSSNIADASRSEYKDLDLLEFRAFLGLLFYTAVFKSNDEDLKSIFATDGTGRDIFRCTISLQRMFIILLHIRFDDSSTRTERKKADPTAAISWLFNKFIENCQSCYSIGEYACVDEMLVGFRGRCGFRVYMPNKPRKYGLKIMAMTDAKTHYLLNAYIYCGKDSDGKTLTAVENRLKKPTQSVIRLAAPIVGTNRNITADNWFSSLELVEELKKRKLTYVGTLRKSKPDIPKEFLPSRVRQNSSSLYGFTKDITLVSYVPKKNKAVILVSSMHHTATTDDSTGKPEIVMFYNETKGGVDALDEKCTMYSTNRRSRRWPLTVFYNLLNISIVNSYVIFSSFPRNNDQSRLDFVKCLSRQLVEPQLQARLQNERLPRELRLTIGRVLNVAVPQKRQQPLNKQVRCTKCPRKSDRKTRFICSDCKSPICGNCCEMRCFDCSL